MLTLSPFSVPGSMMNIQPCFIGPPSRQLSGDVPTGYGDTKPEIPASCSPCWAFHMPTIHPTIMQHTSFTSQRLTAWAPLTHCPPGQLLSEGARQEERKGQSVSLGPRPKLAPHPYILFCSHGSHSASSISLGQQHSASHQTRHAAASGRRQGPEPGTDSRI